MAVELSAAAMRTKVRRALLYVFFKISDLTPNPPPLLSWDAGAKPQDHGPGRGRRITAAIICGRGNAAMAPGVMSLVATARPTQVRSRAFPVHFFALIRPPPPHLDSGVTQEHGRRTMVAAAAVGSRPQLFAALVLRPRPQE